MKLFRATFAFLASLLLVLLPAAGQAATMTSSASVAMTLTIGESVSVTCDSPSIVLGASPVTSFHCTSSWQLNPANHAHVDIAFLVASTVALTGASTGTTIANSNVACAQNGQPASTFVNNQVVGGITLPFTCSGDDSFNITSANAVSSATEPFGVWVPGMGTFPPDSYTGSVSVEILAF